MICPGCALRDADEKVGLCTECERQRFDETVEEVGDIQVMTQEETVEALQRLFLEIFESLKKPERKPTLDAWAAGKAAIVLSVHGCTIERL